MTTRSHGTTTLFAALNILDGAVIGRCMQKHRHQEFIRFLNAIERDVPAGKIIHAVLDNYATHKHPKVRVWLARHPRWVFHFTPTFASWLNAVEGLFSILTRRRLRRGVFKGVVDLQAAINRYLKEHNADPKPFVWTKPASEIFDKLARLPAPSVCLSALGLSIYLDTCIFRYAGSISFYKQFACRSTGRVRARVSGFTMCQMMKREDMINRRALPHIIDRAINSLFRHPQREHRAASDSLSEIKGEGFEIGARDDMTYHARLARIFSGPIRARKKHFLGLPRTQFPRMRKPFHAADTNGNNRVAKLRVVAGDDQIASPS